MSEAQLERPSSPNDLVEIDTAQSAITSQEATAPPAEEMPSPLVVTHQEAREEKSDGGGCGAASEAFELVPGKGEEAEKVEVEVEGTTTAVEAVERKEEANKDESSNGGDQGEKPTEQAQQTNDTTTNNETKITESECTNEEQQRAKSLVIERPKGSTATIGTSTHVTITETQEVSSTRNDEPHPKSARASARRSSYNNGGSRSYAGGYQNYGLTHLPYKSNFEPSEDARRRADEFFKTLKL